MSISPTYVAVAWIASVLFTAYVAAEKGRNPVLWGLLAAAFSVVALVAVAGLPVAGRPDFEEEAWTARENDELFEIHQQILKEVPRRRGWNPGAGPPSAS